MRKRKGYSFWPLASPPLAVEAAVPDWARSEGVLAGEDSPHGHGPMTDTCAAQVSVRRAESLAGARPDKQSSRDVGAETAGGEAARPDVLHTTADRPDDEGASLDGDNVKVRQAREQGHITMCGSRLYSDWEGYWGRSSRSPLLPPCSVLTRSPRRYSAQNPRGGCTVSGGLLPPCGEPGTLGLSCTGLSDHLR